MMRKKWKRRRKGGDEGRKENKESATCVGFETPLSPHLMSQQFSEVFMAVITLVFRQGN